MAREPLAQVRLIYQNFPECALALDHNQTAGRLMYDTYLPGHGARLERAEIDKINKSGVPPKSFSGEKTGSCRAS